ncbi:Alpha/Beta hydrolase protein [Dunaliella salina]|uniref:Prolyl endopeptidase n=1 Tax=Dunaliella salina TaxID=3046 RepID=A0ABQ7G7A7_DUNSA|nr:Alpha/Beta hydrolase protein [Dunaliella salina]|eukprot:KAF5830484.1 Alpha/Beta hydrolase protein [Dunaliella salina]
MTEPTMVVDLVEGAARKVGSPRTFPGLYLAQMIDQPFAGSDIVLLTSQLYCQAAVLAISLSTGKVAPITPVETQDASYSLAAIAGGRVFVTRVSPSTAFQLLVADLPQDPQGLMQGSSLEWQEVEGCGSEFPAEASSRIAEIECRVIEYASSTGPDMACECVCYIPKNRKGPLPTILAPHGGPHAGVTLGWYMPYTFLASLGYAVLLPNFRGSTGYGQAFLEALPGHIGQYDVQDCMDAVTWAVQQGITDPKRLAVAGGSHGGFLSGHLMGQHPDAFKIGILRNPVCNIALMAGVSDIADWCFVEVPN